VETARWSQADFPSRRRRPSSNLTPLVTWSASLHLTFRLLPEPSPHLRPFLEADGLSPQEVLGKLPYAMNRAAGNTLTGTPDPRRYRDGKQVYQNVGLLYESPEGTVKTTDLGRAVLRWLDLINSKNKVILGRHAAYALAACQLRNPTGAGERYDPGVNVFPFAFIWRAMLALEGQISSDEMNRGMFRVRTEEELDACIKRIGDARAQGDPSLIGNEVVTGPARNDRIIPWMSLASFGWILFADKRDASDGSHYTLTEEMTSVVRDASKIRHRHQDFVSVQQYVERLANCAALPKDLR